MARLVAITVGAGVLLLLLAARVDAPGLAHVSAQSTSADTGPVAAPDQAALTRAVQRFVSADATAESCRAIASVRGEQRFECTVTECPGACQVVHVVTVLGLRRGRYRRVSQERVHRGDTGACGCCMAEF